MSDKADILPSVSPDLEERLIAVVRLTSINARLHTKVTELLADIPLPMSEAQLECAKVITHLQCALTDCATELASINATYDSFRRVVQAKRRSLLGIDPKGRPLA